MIISGKTSGFLLGVLLALGAAALSANGGSVRHWNAPQLTTAELAEALEEKGRRSKLQIQEDMPFGDRVVAKRLARVELPIDRLVDSADSIEPELLLNAAFDDKQHVVSTPEARLQHADTIPLKEYMLVKGELLDRIAELEAALASAEETIAATQAVEATTLIRSRPTSSESDGSELKALKQQLRDLKIENEILKQVDSTAKVERISPRVAVLQTKLAEAEAALDKRGSVESDNSYLRKENAELQKELATLKSANKERARLSRGVDKAIARIQRLKSENEELIKQNRSLKQEKKTLENELASSSKLRDELEALADAVSEKETTIAELEQKLAEKDEALARVPELEQEFVKMRNELLLKRTEVAILGGKGSRGVAKKMIQALPKQPQEEKRVSPLKTDVLVARVTGDKVNLRSGPGSEHSPVMQIQRGAGLTVEDRQGDWLRVIAPTGARAYVHRDYVRLEGGKLNEPTAAIPTRRIRPNVESAPENFDEAGLSEAFKRLKSGLSAPR